MPPVPPFDDKFKPWPWNSPPPPLPGTNPASNPSEPVIPGLPPYVQRRPVPPPSPRSTPMFWVLVVGAVILPILLVGTVAVYFFWPASKPAEQVAQQETPASTAPQPAPAATPPAAPTHPQETAPAPQGTVPAPPPAPKAELVLLPIEPIRAVVGSPIQIRVRVQRKNCRGPIALRLEGLPPGFATRDGVIRSDGEEGTLDLNVPPDAPLQLTSGKLIAEAADARVEGTVALTLVPGESRPATPAVAPFDAAQAKEYQRNWATRLHQPVELTNSIGMKLMLIPAGRFTMGTPLDVPDRKPDEHPHEVELTRPYYLGTYEVTQEQYEKLMGANPSAFRGANRPVESVSWEQAVEFCRKLSELPAEKAAGRTYRLPTEAEWEFACRAGTTTLFHYGDALEATQANFDGTQPYGGAAPGPARGQTTPVGSFAPNAFGLYDMHGNVWEWCFDSYDAEYYKNSPEQNPLNESPVPNRVHRGGSWKHDGRYCFSAGRGWYAASMSDSYLGFRIALIVTPKQ